VEDPELKYGLSVTGIVHPKKFLTNAGAKPGDLLILTKPLGTGILATALKASELSKNAALHATEQMATLNKDAAEVMSEVGVSACTDITGFGLLGHCLEMAKASYVGIRIDTQKVPIIPEVKTFAAMGLIPGGSYANQKFYLKDLWIDSNVDSILLDILFDPQTSGGLLISVPKNKALALVQNLKKRNVLSANIIGSIENKTPGTVRCY
ncbi:MAG: selenide, water dikinase SelD, partial [Firmicutes bacterium]|nr:selenide, water dikinase SelD [Bacillota bacterium]